MKRLTTTLSKRASPNPTESEPAYWFEGQIWIAPGNQYNPKRRNAVTLLELYEQGEATPPTPDAVDSIVAALATVIPREAREEFLLHVVIAQATAKDYHA